MTTDNRHDIHCDWVLDRLEAYLDKDLPTGELGPLESHLNACDSCARELSLARQVQTALRALPEQNCPDAVVTAALSRIETAPARAAAPLARRLSEWWRQYLNPVAAAAAIMLVVAMTVFIGREQPIPTDLANGFEDTLDLSAEELALVKAEIKWTFAYLGSVGRRSGLAVRDEALTNYVVKPIERAAQTAFESRTTDRTE